MLDAFRDQKSKSSVLNSTTQTPVFSRVRYNIIFLELEWECCDLGALANLVKFMETE